MECVLLEPPSFPSLKGAKNPCAEPLPWIMQYEPSSFYVSDKRACKVGYMAQQPKVSAKLPGVGVGAQRAVQNTLVCG